MGLKGRSCGRGGSFSQERSKWQVYNDLAKMNSPDPLLPRMLLRFVTVVIVFAAATPAMAQDDRAVVSGRVLDGASGSPIGFASIVLERTGAKQTGTLSADNGRFVVQGLAPGTYKVRISFPGFHPAAADLARQHAQPDLRPRRHPAAAPRRVREERSRSPPRRFAPRASTRRCSGSTTDPRSPPARCSTR